MVPVSRIYNYPVPVMECPNMLPLPHFGTTKSPQLSNGHSHHTIADLHPELYQRNSSALATTHHSIILLQKGALDSKSKISPINLQNEDTTIITTAIEARHQIDLMNIKHGLKITCPHCMEEVKAGATVCIHCKRSMIE